MKLKYISIVLSLFVIIGLTSSCKKEKKPTKNQQDDKSNDPKPEIRLNNVTWSKIKTGPFNGETVSSTARLNGKYYVSTSRAIYTSDNGENFTYTQKLGALSFVGIELHQSRNELFAFSQGTPIYRLDNGNWNQITIPGLITPLKNYSCQMLTNDSGHIYLFSGDNVGDAMLFKSRDLGKNWEQINMPTGTFSSFAIYKKNEILLLSKTGVMHSVNNGTTWQNAVTGYNVLSKLFVHPDGVQMVMYDIVGNLMIYGTLDNLTSEYCSFGNNFLLGYNSTGYLFASDISDDNGQYIKYSHNNGKTWLGLGITPKYLTQASIIGGSVFGVMENSLVHLEDGAVRYRLFGTPTLPIADFVKKGNKITAVGKNTIIYTSEDNGHTWTIGTVKAPFGAAAKCLYIDKDNSIWIGTTSGLFVVDAFASSVLLNQSFNLNNYYVTAIDRDRGYTILGLSHKDLNSGYVALAIDGSLSKYTLYQIYGLQNHVISYAEVSYFSNGKPSFKVSVWAPGFGVWYNCYATLNGNVITEWEKEKNNFFGGNAFLMSGTNVSKGYTIGLYQGNNYEIRKNDRTGTTGKMNTTGNFTHFWIDEQDYGWALIDGFLNKSSGELVSL